MRATAGMCDAPVGRVSGTASATNASAPAHEQPKSAHAAAGEMAATSASSDCEVAPASA